MKVYLRFIPMVTIMGMIFFLSHQPYDSVQLPEIVGIDKFAHVVTYGFLAASFLYGLQPFIRSADFIIVVIVVLFCLLYGISDEYHQSFIPGRFVSKWDVIADVLGALLITVFWYRYNKQKSARKYS